MRGVVVLEFVFTDILEAYGSCTLRGCGFVVLCGVGCCFRGVAVVCDELGCVVVVVLLGLFVCIICLGSGCPCLFVCSIFVLYCVLVFLWDVSGFIIRCVYFIWM